VPDHSRQNIRERWVRVRVRVGVRVRVRVPGDVGRAAAGVAGDMCACVIVCLRVFACVCMCLHVFSCVLVCSRARRGHNPTSHDREITPDADHF